MKDQPKPKPTQPRPPADPNALRIIFCLDCVWCAWEKDMRWLSDLWHAHADDEGHAAYRWEA